MSAKVFHVFLSSDQWTGERRLPAVLVHCENCDHEWLHIVEQPNRKEVILECEECGLGEIVSLPEET